MLNTAPESFKVTTRDKHPQHVSCVHPRFQNSQTGGEASPAGCEEIPADELQEGDGQAEVHAGLLGRECGGGRGAGEDSQPHRGPGGQAAAEAQSGRSAGAAQGDQCPECRGHQECHRAHDGKQSVTEHRVTASSSLLHVHPLFPATIIKKTSV